jgi:YHS domain-containing protein
VLLTQGKEVQGKMKIFVMRSGYMYLFANEENKAIFEKDPTTYEIQLDGACARMGAQVGGNADLYTVYKNRIYIFGSEECLTLFKATPEKYAEPVQAQMTASPEAFKKGQALIEKAVDAVGGAAKIDSLATYQETGEATTITQDGEVHYKTALTKQFPDRVRREQVRNFGTISSILSPGGAFGIFQNEQRKNSAMMRNSQRIDMEKQIRRNTLEILRARKQSDFKAAFTGEGKVGDTTVQQVVVAFSGLQVRLGIDAATGRILSLAYTGRSQANGEVGEMVQAFSDFRNVDGLTLPFKISGTFNGKADPSLSYTVESIAINGKIDPAVFEKPVS